MLCTVVEIAGRKVKSEVTITNDCGVLTARVELSSVGCEPLPNVESISLRIRGCETVSFRMDRLCNKGSNDRLVFVSACGERFRDREGTVELKLDTHCDSERVRWRDVNLH
ncbi:MAG: hypothetical protein ACOYN0_16820 [Phycisphaerales bacterium]